MREEIFEKIYLSDRNLIIDGEMSTGKTSNVVFPLLQKIIKRRESFLVIDSKEEYLNQYYHSLKNKGYHNIVINLREMSNSDGFNVLAYPYKLYLANKQDKALEYVRRIYSQLFSTSVIGDDFWESSAVDFLTGVTLALFKDGATKEIHLDSINAMINAFYVRFGGPNNNYLKEYFNKKDKNDTSYILASSTIFGPKETAGGILSTASQKLVRFVSNKKVSQLLSKTTFDYKDILNKPTAIFVVTKDEDISMNSLASIFINQLYFILFENKIKNRFHFILDNFDTIDNIVNLREMLSSDISRNMKFTIVTRSIEEVNEKYGHYINKLSDVVNVDDQAIHININEKKESLSNPKVEIKTVSSNYHHKKNRNREVRVFDLPKSVRNRIKIDMLKTQEIFPKDDKEKHNVGVSIDKINQKIAELEQADNQKVENNSSLVDDLLQKINNRIAQLESEEEARSINHDKDFSIEILFKKIDKRIAEMEEEEKKTGQLKENKKSREKFNPFSDSEMAKVEVKREKKISKKIKPRKLNPISCCQVKEEQNDFGIDKIIEKIDEKLEELDFEGQQDIQEVSKKFRKRRLKKEIILDQKLLPSDDEINTTRNNVKKKSSLVDFFKRGADIFPKL